MSCSVNTGAAAVLDDRSGMALCPVCHGWRNIPTPLCGCGVTAMLSAGAEALDPICDPDAALKECMSAFFASFERPSLREALAALLHDLFRARLEELVKGMPLKDGGLRLDAETAARVAALCRTNFEFVEAKEQERARADADRLLKTLSETR